MVAAACNDIEADRGDLVGDSLRGTAVPSIGEAMIEGGTCCSPEK
jgi:hypothetical protein